MNINEARQIIALARSEGTLKYDAEKRARFVEAKKIAHEYNMENDASYRRIFREKYIRMAIGTGRLDLVGKCD